jgi:hypothetical protein
MVDGAGGFFTAFKAAMSVGKGGGGGRQPGGPQGYPGAVEDHPGWDFETGTCSAHPQGCADSANGGGHPWKGGEGFGGGGQEGEPGGEPEPSQSWGHPGTEGRGLGGWGR